MAVKFSTGFLNGRLTTQAGEIEVTPSGDNINLYIKGPRGGLRHWVIIPRREAGELAKGIHFLSRLKAPRRRLKSGRIMEERVNSARTALEAAYTPVDEDSIVDLVTDLLHLARESNVEPDFVIHMAQIHYDAETGG